MLETMSYKSTNGARTLKYLLVPYLRAQVNPEYFKPLICYLYTDWQCNIDCHYCFQNDSNLPGMTLETAKSSIDWLKSLGCRVLALMGGEPTIRRDFLIEVIHYGAENGFFVYLPTNGYLLDKSFIDEIGKAGVGTINLAVDCVAPRKGLPKALLNIEPQFRYMLEKRRKYGYIPFFNINICRTNIRDVKLLTEIAHQNYIGTDYHLNEPPLGFVNIDNYKHQDDGLHITPDKYDEVDDLLDWLIEKQKQGWPMVNSVAHLEAFKDRMRGRIKPWGCRAGQSAALIRTDGSLAPCFDLMSYDEDWGSIWEPKFEGEKLDVIKEKCLPKCSSTCFYNISHYYNPRWIPQWIKKNMIVG